MNAHARRGARRVTTAGVTVGVVLAVAAAAGADLETVRGGAVAAGILVAVVLTPAGAISLSSRRNRITFALATLALIVVTVAGSTLAYLLAWPLAGTPAAEFSGATVSIVGLYSIGVSVGAGLIAGHLVPARRARRSTTSR